MNGKAVLCSSSSLTVLCVLTRSNMKKSSAARAPNMSPMISIRMPANTAPPYPLLNICELVTMPLDTQDMAATSEMTTTRTHTSVHLTLSCRVTPGWITSRKRTFADDGSRFVSLSDSPVINQQCRSTEGNPEALISTTGQTSLIHQLTNDGRHASSRTSVPKYNTTVSTCILNCT